jgi:hypothetical protein
MIKKIVHTVIQLADASELYMLLFIAVVSLIKN